MRTIGGEDAFPEFAWVVGEEGSDPMVLSDGAPYRQDQFEQSGHYSHVDDDLRSIAALGVRIVRYGVPWRLTEPEPGHYDWTLWDRALARCADHGLEPIVDMLHFGLPDSFDGFADQQWVDSFGRYVEAFLNRYQEPRWFTPINEPGPTAENSGGPLFDLLAPWSDQLSTNGGGSTNGPVSHFLGGLATVLGRYDEADSYFARAAMFNSRAQAMFFAVQSDLLWGRMLAERRAPGDTDRARELLTKTRTIAVTNGYGGVERRAAVALEDLG